METDNTFGKQSRARSGLLVPSPLTLPPPPLPDLVSGRPKPSDRACRSPVSPSDLLDDSPRAIIDMGRPDSKAPPSSHLVNDMETVDSPVGPPSYEQSKDDLQTDAEMEEAQNGINGTARFGRWGPWVEKRGIERYEQYRNREARRAERRILDTHRPPSYDSTVSSILNVPLNLPPRLPSPSPRLPQPHFLPVITPSIAPGSSRTPLHPTDLSRIDYGSRFIPHATAPITSYLTFPGGLTLLGTTQGLQVLIHGPEKASRVVWTGLPVWDISLLKYDPGNGDIPRGSVLVLCGGTEGEPGRPKKEAEARVWKLESLASLARWAAVQEGFSGLDLASKKGKGKGISKAFRTTPPSSSSSKGSVPVGMDIARRWAADYTMLPAGPGQSVLSLAVHVTDQEMALALATPSSIVLHRGQVTSKGSYAFSPARTFYIPFPPTSLSLVDLEIPGSMDDIPDNTTSSLFEWDDTLSQMSLGEGVSGGTLGIFVAFAGARGCVIRTSDSGVVELKKGGRGEWLPVNKVRLATGEINIFTRGTTSFMFSAPLTIPLAMQIPIAEVTWPELPASIHATTNSVGGVRLLGLTSSGTLHVIDVNAMERGIEKDWSSVSGQFGLDPRFLAGGKNRAIHIGFKRTERDWRIASLIEEG